MARWNQRFEIAENFANDCKKQQNDKIKQQIITYLPELSSYLVTALAGLEMDNLSHIEAKQESLVSCMFEQRDLKVCKILMK